MLDPAAVRHAIQAPAGGAAKRIASRAESSLAGALVDTVQVFDHRQTRQLVRLLCRQEEPAVATLVEAVERPPANVGMVPALLGPHRYS